MTWQPIETAPFETLVLTFWPGDYRRNPVMLINSRSSGHYMGKRYSWWHSLPDQQPTHWMPLPQPPEVTE